MLCMVYCTNQRELQIFIVHAVYNPNCMRCICFGNTSEVSRALYIIIYTYTSFFVIRMRQIHRGEYLRVEVVDRAYKPANTLFVVIMSIIQSHGTCVNTSYWLISSWHTLAYGNTAQCAAVLIYHR